MTKESIEKLSISLKRKWSSGTRKPNSKESIQALMKIEDLFIYGTDIYADRENMGLIARNALEKIK